MNELVSKSYELTTTDPSALAMAEAAKARISAMYIMALKKPRNEDQARIRILEACRRPEFADRVEYSKPMGGEKKVRGPSIRFAETALRLWENIESDIQVIYDDPTVRRIKIRMTDLETNASYTKELSIRKTVERKSTRGRTPDEIFGERINTYGDKVYIVAATEDEMMVKESAMISKAIRTEGLRLIPSDIVDEARSVAAETLAKKDSQDPAAAKKKVLDAFAAIGIKPNELEKYLKHKVDTISPAELADLRAVHAALKEGDATWADYVQADEPSEPGKPVTFQDDSGAGGKATRKPRSDKGRHRILESSPEGTENAKEGAGEVQGAVNGPNPTIGQGLEDTEEWGILNDLIKEKRMGYLQLKIDLKMPQGPKDLAQTNQMIAALEAWTPKPPMREPGED
jgi:hypothetical protein